MAGKESAGILLFRRAISGLEVLLVHPGGPYWAKRDLGCWSIPKGEIAIGEDPLVAAKREFREELGVEIDGAFKSLGVIQQPGGKRVHGFALEGDVDAEGIRSNTFELEWPPRSGQIAAFPEVDRAAWFSLKIAREKINSGQIGLLEALMRLTR